MHTKADQEDNGISCGTADEDGIMLKENVTGTGIYIYYSEIDNIVQQMRKLRFENEKRCSENRASTKELQTSNKLEFKKLSEYYKTDEWKRKRMNRLRMDAFRCVNCGGSVDLDVHHLGYDRFGVEDVKSDLRTLCRRCHGEVTKGIRRGRV